MTALSTDVNSIVQTESNLYKDYSWFYSNIYSVLKNSMEEFFQKSLEIRFMGISYEDNVLSYGDEYFVNKIPVCKSSDFKMKLSSELIEYILYSTLGKSKEKFKLNKLSHIEAMLIKSFTVFVYKNVEEKFDKTEKTQKQIQLSKNLNLTFFVRKKEEHLGKIIISFPEHALKEIERKKLPDVFSLADFKKTMVGLKLAVGKSKIALNDIRAIEEGDIMVLENSDINKMAVILDGKEILFKINPNPSLIISIDNNGGDEMGEETNTNPQNMWDSILVDVVAEFDNVKLTLGELKQISEGLVIDVGSVYENKVKLRVENQVVATGELVILNDRYGVRIEEVSKTKEQQKAPAKAQPNVGPNIDGAEAAPQANAPARRPVPPRAGARPAARPGVRPAAAQPAPKEGDENFDYSDFEIEDESI